MNGSVYIIYDGRALYDPSIATVLDTAESLSEARDSLRQVRWSCSDAVLYHYYNGYGSLIFDEPSKMED